MESNLDKDEPLYKLHPDSDFELLLFARTQIKELQEVIRMQQVEIGKRDSEILELPSRNIGGFFCCLRN